MGRTTGRATRFPISIRHAAFGEIAVRASDLEPITRGLRGELKLIRTAGATSATCRGRHLLHTLRALDASTRDHLATLGEAVSEASGRDRRRLSMMADAWRPGAALRQLTTACGALDEDDDGLVEIVCPAIRVRGRGGRTHANDVVLRALCERHRISIASPPSGVELAHGDAAPLHPTMPRAAVEALPTGFPHFRMRSLGRDGGDVVVAMWWPRGLRYESICGHATITIDDPPPATVLASLVGRNADVVADVPGFDRIRITRVRRDDDGCVVVKGSSRGET